MNNIYLPELLSLKISNFSLYPNGLNYEYDFVKGINFIIGGNGMGKTTFVNIIKYGIIGHYKEGYDLTRTYKGNKIEKRTPYPLNYFSKRTENSINPNKPAFIECKFKVNDTIFEIKRGLTEIKLEQLHINSKLINGQVISQKKYDKLFYNHSRQSDEEEKRELLDLLEKTISYKFEKEIEKASNIKFDDLIFFVNKILFFGEDHKTILWDDDPLNDVQTELFNKYFNDRNLNEERQEALRQAKYFDTQARHRSEDIRVIKKVIENVSPNQKDESNLNSQISYLREKKSEYTDQIELLQEERKSLEKEVKIKTNEMNGLSLDISKYEQEAKEQENENLKRKWVTLHKNYDSFYKSISNNEICPLCSQDLEESFVKKAISNNSSCILCTQAITINEETNTSAQNAKKTAEKIHKKIHALQDTILTSERKLEKLDSKFRNVSQKLRSLNHEIRLIEYKQVDDDNSSEQIDNLQSIFAEIEKLEIAKENFQRKSKKQKTVALEISKKIETVITKNVKQFSEIFSSFAESFLGLTAKLTYEEYNNQMRFLPIIDGKVREMEEELSESQRFFVDHSFRMSILTFFYNKPSFYIVETPDSSLDISYEENAANVFIKFLEKPYSIILTTNLNNSEFLNYLAESKIEKGVINLLEIGKSSPIQHNNDLLMNVFSKVQSKLNEA